MKPIHRKFDVNMLNGLLLTTLNFVRETKTMRRLFFYMLFLISFAVVSSNQLKANEPLYTMVETEEPFDYKLIHPSGTRECYLTFYRNDEKIDKNALVSAVLESAEAKFGRQFWKKLNLHSPARLINDNNMLLDVFIWLQEDSIENVFVFAFNDSSDPNDCCCILLIDKAKPENFNREDSDQCLMEDIRQLALSIIREELPFD